MIRLNIGGQKGRKEFPKGWKMLDIRDGADIQVDLLDAAIPLANHSVQAIYTSHTLEHIFPDRLPFILKEFHRILVPKGPIRIVVPNIDIAISSYVKKNNFLKNKNNPSKMDILPNLPIYHLSSWFFTYKQKNKDRIMNGHLNVFNANALSYYLCKAGFENIKEKKYQKGSSIFKNCDFKRYKDCSLYMEGQT